MRKLYNIVIPLSAVAVTQYNTYSTHIIYADEESSSVDTDNSLSDIESDSADQSPSDSPNESAGPSEDKNTDSLYSYWQSLIKTQFVASLRSYYTPNDPKPLMGFNDRPKTKLTKTKKYSLDLKKNLHGRSTHSCKRYLFFPAHSVSL